MDEDSSSSPEQKPQQNQLRFKEIGNAFDLKDAVNSYIPDFMNVVLRPRSFLANQEITGTAPAESFELSSIAAQPKQFLIRLVADPKLTQPAGFLIISALICAVLFIVSGNFWIGIGSLFANVIGTYLVSLFATVAVRFFADRGDYPNTFRIFAYSQAPLVIAWIGPFHLGAVVATVYSLCLQVIGIEAIYKMQLQRAAVMVMVLTLVGVVLKSLLGVSSL